MFSKRKKKEFPAGTFIPTKARVLAILQLCLAFTAIVWSAGLPFMGELFDLKSQGFLYQTVMGNEELAKQIGKSQDAVYLAHLQRNKNRFAELPLTVQEELVQRYNALQHKANALFTEKLYRSVQILVVETPPFEQAWIAFAIVISLMLLLRIEGALPALWLLPLIVVCYGVDNRLQGKESPKNLDLQLFPKEEVIVKDYLKEPLSQNILQQQQQLMHGWQMYLVQEWAHETPSQDPKLFEQQAEQGEFFFNVARLKIQTENLSSQPLHQKKPLLLILIYFLWNLFFAWSIHKTMRKEELKV